MNTRATLTQRRRLVIKIGSSLITRDGQGLAVELMADWARQLAELAQTPREIVLVSSGAVAEGMARLGWKQRPHALHELQAAAAVGQMGLIQCYETSFKQFGLATAQILLTHSDLSDRQRYLNARSTLKTLLALKTIPIINENDTVATEEIRFGDNDTLAALVANLIEADTLVILTDQQGLFNKDPRQHSDATLISEAQVSDPQLQTMAGSSGGALGRGGMLTKIRASRIAARSGADTLIASGRESNVLPRLFAGENIGTWLQAGQAPLNARKRWLASGLTPRGSLVLDDGAIKVLTQAGKSLLPVGVIEIEGDFQRGDLVRCVDKNGQEIARGLVNYDADEAARIKGHASHQIEALLNYIDEPELIHRDNLVLSSDV
ncbi:MAG: glutamate 5-kinase [Gammaproteobacteria bacterium]|nr:glutamate 5-kinase [Gammaproteobacteria bacterium]